MANRGYEVMELVDEIKYEMLELKFVLKCKLGVEE
jgi:hypothetical protein